MATKKFLIVLSGQGDVEIKLTHSAAKKWIEKEWDDRTERIPKAILKAYPVEDPEYEKVEVCGSSGDNDRALACPGESFDSLTDVLAHIKANNIEIVGDFVGYIY